jgi:hypothetical protein
MYTYEIAPAKHTSIDVAPAIHTIAAVAAAIHTKANVSAANHSIAAIAGAMHSYIGTLANHTRASSAAKAIHANAKAVIKSLYMRQVSSPPSPNKQDFMSHAYDLCLRFFVFSIRLSYESVII